MRRGAIILCGGKSSRMGRDKASLPFGPETMLQRVVRLASDAVDQEKIVVVASPDQGLPPLPPRVRMVRDEQAYRGPLAGLATGLRALGRDVDAAFATGCDAPLLQPAFVRRIFELLADHDIVVPFDGEFHHALAAVYRTTALPAIDRLLAAEQLRPRFLFAEVNTREVTVDELSGVDPQLSTLANLNSRADYVAALAAAGFDAPPVDWE